MPVFARYRRSLPGVILGLALLAVSCAVPLPTTVQSGAPAATPRAAGVTVFPGAGTPMPAVDWQRYEGAGYTLSYPPDAYLTAGHNRDGVYTARIQFRLPGVPGYQGMLVRVEPNPGHEGVERVAARLYGAVAEGQSDARFLAQIRSITVSDLAAVRATATQGDFAIVVPYADKVYVIAPVHGAASPGLDPAALRLFEQVLGSFRVGR